MPHRQAALRIKLNNFFPYFFWCSLSVLEWKNCSALPCWPGIGVGLSRYCCVFTLMSVYPYCASNGPGLVGCSGIFILERGLAGKKVKPTRRLWPIVSRIAGVGAGPSLSLLSYCSCASHSWEQTQSIIDCVWEPRSQNRNCSL